MRTTTFLMFALIVISGCTARTDGGARVRPLPGYPATSSEVVPNGIPLNDGSAPIQNTYGQPGEVIFPDYQSNPIVNNVETPTAIQPQQQQPTSTYTTNAPMIPGKSNNTGSSVEATPQPPQKQTGAIQSLLDEANAAVQANQLEKAATALNRAVRLEPNNASIWYDLAQIRLHQRKYDQSEQLAKKSIDFAKGNQDLINKNWRIISSARTANGDSAGADEAMRNAQ